MIVTLVVRSQTITLTIGALNTSGGGGGGGSGDVVGPASATDDRLAAFDGVTGKLIKQGTVTATAVASHLGSTSNPHSVTAAQVGADPTGTAAAAVSTHAGAVDPHGDRAYADGLAGNYATAGHNHSGVYQPADAELTAIAGLVSAADKGIQFTGVGTAATFDLTAAGKALLDDADANTQRATLGLGGAAVLAVGTTAGTVAAGDDSRLSDARTPTAHNQDASTITSGTLDAARLPAPDTTTLGGVKRNTGSEGQFVTGVDTDGSLLRDTPVGGGTPAGSGTELQYRDGSTFGAMSGTAWDNTTRALTVTGATIEASAPILDLSQTWDNAAVTFTGVKVNITNTASAAASKPFDVQVGGATVFSVRADGAQVTNNYGLLYTGGYLVPTDTAFVNAANFRASSIGFSTKLFLGAGGATSGPGFLASANETGGLSLVSSTNTAYAPIAVSTVAIYGTGTAATARALLEVPAGDILEQRRGTATQEKRLYRSYTDASNYSRLAQRFNTTTAVIHAEGAGTGSDGSVAFNDAALATNATVGFLMIPSCAGTPSGTPADIPTGQIPLVWDSTNLKLYAYTGGAWKSSAAFT